MAKIKRVPTGIPGFDNLVKGGLIEKSTTLLSGGAGTGKTIFGVQFLYNGAEKYDEPGVMLSFEEDADDIYRDTDAFGWNLEKHVKDNKLSLLYEDPTDISKFSKHLEEEVIKLDAKRVVFDSTSVLGLSLENAHEVRMKLFDLISLLRKLGVTSILTAETLEDTKGLSRFGVEEFIVDGVIRIHYTGIGGENSSHLQVRKMRATDLKRGFFPMEFTNKGISILTEEGASVLLK